MFLPRIIQVEVTTACQLGCIFCARTALAKQWITTHMHWDVFALLLPFVSHTELVHLQGWGEPLLHPRFWDMVAAIKEKQGRVSLTTNAVLLDAAACHEACQTGVDLIAVSVAGARAGTNDSLRVGSNLEQVCANISYLCRLEHRPKVNLIMQMMKPNLEELPELVTLAAKLGADAVIAPNLDYIPTIEVDALKAFGLSADLSHVDIINEAQARGKELGIEVSIYPLSPRDDIVVCDADPLHNVWVTVFGEIAPCPYTALPCRNRIPRLFWGKESHLPRFSFGKVVDRLDKVLNSPRALAFRQAFLRRLQWQDIEVMVDSQDELDGRPELLSSSVGFLQYLAQVMAPQKPAGLPPAPDLCQDCYKLYGL